MLEIVKSNVVQHAVKPIPPMYCFGGYNVAIEIDKIKTIDVKYYESYKTGTLTPILHFELESGAVITVDYETIEEAEKAKKSFQKHCIMKVTK